MSAVTKELADFESNASGAPPKLSGGWPLIGHLLALRKNPIDLFWRVRNELGEIGEINFAGNRIVMMIGEEVYGRLSPKEMKRIIKEYRKKHQNGQVTA